MPSSPSALLDGWRAPAPAPARVAFLSERPFAHRGLHDAGLIAGTGLVAGTSLIAGNGAARIENSRAAADAAIALGHGIECDVQASRDDVAFVFHDADLARLTGEAGALRARPARVLEAIRLAGTDETIPTLRSILARVLGRVPLLVEMKAPGRRVAPLCLAVRRDLEGYRGAVAVMSFNPEVSRWFAAHAAHVVRGLVVTEGGKRHARGRIERRLALWRARPDFIAYDVRDLPSRFAAAQRARGLPVLAWTVRGEATERVARAHADQIIYERAA